MSTGNLLVLQSGGPTAVLNTTLAAVISEAQHHQVAKILGALHGVNGLIHAHFADLTSLSQSQLNLLASTPAAALGSSRTKPSDNDLARILDNLAKHQVRHLLLVGGNGSLKGAQAIHEAALRNDQDLNVIGIPKTIDNDIASIDRCPGYASAARYMAQAVRDLGADVRALPQPVSILETMGRSVGWVAAATALARTDEDSAPHLIYLPENPFIMQQFLADVDRTVTRAGYCIVVAPEGLKDPSGNMVYETSNSAQKDAMNRPLPGDIALYLAGVVSKELKIRCRSEKPGLCARASIATRSEQDVKDADLVGRVAVRAALAGDRGMMVSLRPLGSTPNHDLIPLSQGAGHERPIPTEWITDGHLRVSEAFLNYARPLVGPLQDYAPPFML
ncbi:MAG TPA: diphosphate--fructose-6-phosphate 1-phosphotransferase [Tepidisphaeraceae bacterium]